MNIFALAEALHKTAGEIKEMPVSEFYGWMEYFNRKVEQKDDSNNLLSADPNSMVAALTGG